MNERLSQIDYTGQFDRYQIIRELGSGMFGKVFLAQDSSDGQDVAIKILFSPEPNLQRFLVEARAMMQLRHSHIVQLRDFGITEKQTPFLVMDYAPNGTLRQRHEGQCVPLTTILSYVMQISGALQAAHDGGIIHRDVKPANMLLNEQDQVLLSDFGVAKMVLSPGAPRSAHTVVGTIAYMAPEQAAGSTCPASDQYSLAIAVYEWICGQLPFRKMVSIQDHCPPSLVAQNIMTPTQVEQVVFKALAKDPGDRYPQIKDFALALAWAVHSPPIFAFGTRKISLGLGLHLPAKQFETTPSPDQLLKETQDNPRERESHPEPIAAAREKSLSLSSADSLRQEPVSCADPRPRHIIFKYLDRYKIPLAILIAFIVLGSGGYATWQSFQGSPTGIGVTMINNEPIGLSDGSFAFDTALDDGSLKSQAAQIIRQKGSDLNPAVSLLNQAISKNSNDAEALIYQEDLAVLNSSRPYVTIVVGTILSGSDITLGRDDLQGAYVAQKEFNDGSKLHGGVQVRLLIANAGSNANNLVTLVQQIVQVNHADKTFIGVMGWPLSGYTIPAAKMLSQNAIPLISQTASSDQLASISPYFFRVSPSDFQQATIGAQYAINVLHAKKVVLFDDPRNPYSQDLAQDFLQGFEKGGGHLAVEEQYTVGQSGILPQELQNALQKNPDFIYFSGYAHDVSTLLANNIPNNLPILGGDGLYYLGEYSNTARVSGFTHLHFTAFSYPDEWDVLGYSNQKPLFFAEYAADFDPNHLHVGSPYGFTRADNDVMLSYDATITILNAYNLALNPDKQIITPEGLHQALRMITGKNTVQGVSGQIAFDQKSSNPVHKAVVMLYVDQQGNIHMDPNLLGGQFMK